MRVAPFLIVLLTSCFPRSGREPQDTDSDTATVDTNTADTDTAVDTDSGVLDIDDDGSPDDVDCNDADNSIHPGATEVCDDIDQDCDGNADDGLSTATYYADTDKDGYGNAAQTVADCAVPAGYVATSGDCADTNKAVHPGATETCDGVDTNCSGDESDATNTTTYYRDADVDTYGALGTSTKACSAPSGHVVSSTDCLDSNKDVHPGATEVCNGIDDDCEGGIDEGLGAVIYFADGDGDGYGGSTTKSACSPPVGYVTTPGDCNDNSAAIKPGAVELCDGIDNNCTGGIDDGLVTTTYYLDGDVDGVGGTTSKAACAQPSGYVSSTGDCNDGNAAIKPGAPETCNGTDNNCSGDENDASNAITYYRDADVDTYGALGTTTKACSTPNGYVLTSTDCNDADTAIHPFAAEVCDGIDNDCEGGIDEFLGAITYYLDGDSDGVGGTTSKSACAPPNGYVTTTGDCNDGDALVKPGAPETCNGTDNNCSGNENDATNAITYYRDADVDTYGALGSTTKACSVPGGYTTNSTDCDDTKSAVHPLATETCDGTDEDCNGKGEVMHVDGGDLQTDAMSLGSTPGTVTVCGTSNRCPASRSSGDLGDQDWLRYSTTLATGHFAGTLTWTQAADMDIIVMLWTGGNAGTRGDGTLTTPPENAFYDFNTGGPPLGGDLYFRIACRAGTPGAWRADVVLP